MTIYLYHPMQPVLQMLWCTIRHSIGSRLCWKWLSRICDKWSFIFLTQNLPISLKVESDKGMMVDQ